MRIKVGETVLSGVTSSKANLYSNHDIRILFNFKQDVFGIVCGEECILLAGQDKIEHDKSKLLREGELMQITLLSGPNSSFYASQITKKIKYVTIPQFSQLEVFINVIEKLLMSKKSVEKTHELNESILTRID